MTTKCRRRAINSLSYQKFIDRLNKGLPIFVAYGEEKNGGIRRHDDCRNMHWHAWIYPSPNSAGAYFIDITTRYPSMACENQMSLLDMNVWRNKYNKNFAFRTRRAAERYIQDITVPPVSFPGPAASPSAFKKLVDKIRAKI